MSQSLLPQDYWTVAGSQALAILVGNTKNLWAPFLSACAKVEGLVDETDPLDHYTELSLDALAQPRCRPDLTLLHSCIIGRCPAATSWVTCQGVAEGYVHDSCSCSCQISTISYSPQPLTARLPHIEMLHASNSPHTPAATVSTSFPAPAETTACRGAGRKSTQLFDTPVSCQTAFLLASSSSLL